MYVAQRLHKNQLSIAKVLLGAAIGAGITTLGFLRKKIVNGVMAGTKKIQEKVEEVKASKKEEKTEKK